MRTPNFPFRLVALDLDGTLLDSQHRLPPRSVQALRRLQEQGVRLVLASGRPHVSVAPLAKSLGIHQPILSFNGAMLQASPDGPLLFHHPVPPEWVARIIEYAEERGYSLNLYPEGVWHVREDNRWTRLYARRTSLAPVVRPDLYAWMRGRPSTKVILFAEPQETPLLLREWQARVGEQLYVTISEPEHLEFMASGVSKGEALRWLQEHWGISPDETAAFGDSLNDVPLLEAAGYRVAMANARPEVKAVAHEIAPSNDEEGVVQVLERWLGEGQPWGSF